MNAIEPLKKPFNLNSPFDQAIIRRLVKSAQRNGQLHIPRKPEQATVPKHKLQIVG